MQNSSATVETEGLATVELAPEALLKFEEPRLEKRGDLTEVTAGAFGPFSP